MADSRRGLFEIHAEEQARLLRCLLCQRWIETDHEEALALDRARTTTITREVASGEAGLGLVS